MAHHSWHCSYNIDTLSAIHDETTRAYPEGHIRLLEMAKQGIRSEICCSRATHPEAFGCRRLLSEFRSRWVCAKAWRHIRNIFWRNQGVCARANTRTHMRTHLRTTDDRGGFAETMTHLWDISQSLHWFRIAFIYRILKLERSFLLPSPSRKHTTRGGIECQGEKHKIGKMNHARHSTSDGWHPNSSSWYSMCIDKARRVRCIHKTTCKTLRAYKQDSRVNKRRLIQNF